MRIDKLHEPTPIEPNENTLAKHDVHALEEALYLARLRDMTGRLHAAGFEASCEFTYNGEMYSQNCVVVLRPEEAHDAPVQLYLTAGEARRLWDTEREMGVPRAYERLASSLAEEEGEAPKQWMRNLEREADASDRRDIYRHPERPAQ